MRMRVERNGEDRRIGREPGCHAAAPGSWWVTLSPCFRPDSITKTAIRNSRRGAESRNAQFNSPVSFTGTYPTAIAEALKLLHKSPRVAQFRDLPSAAT